MPIGSKAARSSTATADEVDAEIDALLAKIPDKYGGSSPSKSSRSVRSKSSQWRCEPVTLVISVLLVIAVTVLVYLSLSPKPFWAFKELQGHWVLEAQGSASRRMAFLALDELVTIDCETPSILKQPLHSASTTLDEDAKGAVQGDPLMFPQAGGRGGDGGEEDGEHRTTAAERGGGRGDEDKIVGNLANASCRFRVGPFVVDRSDMHFTAVRANTLIWVWAGPCHDHSATSTTTSDDDGKHNDGLSSATPPVCSLAVHRKRLHLTIYRPDGHVYSYMMTRAQTSVGDGDAPATSWAAFWQEKGRFMVTLVVVVVVLKGFQHALTPKQNMSQRLAEHRLARQKSAAAQLARMERDEAASAKH